MIDLLSLILLPLLGSIGSQSFPEVLTPEEEEAYLKRWQQGDEDARNALIEHNLRLVAHIVKKFETPGKTRTIYFRSAPSADQGRRFLQL